MPIKRVQMRLSDAVLRDLDWLAEKHGGLDRTNTVRVLITEAKARKLEEERAARPDRHKKKD
ncbi:hypothetical protein [Silvibacterium acidisoli]|uniref:hypothetical protein n=1 Tax=Acidobacteriaceae bacterium ZG23-2 TaxID=2883246 RepID=UPI00406C05DD